MKLYIILVVTAVTIFASLYVSDACNGAVCASIVSKCMLIKCCECDMTDVKNCTCCTDCQRCLAKLYPECCSCVGLCPHPDTSDDLSKSSTVEDLSDPIPDLFNVLTEEEDAFKRWTSFTYQPYIHLTDFKPGMKPNLHVSLVTDKKTSPKEHSHGNWDGSQPVEFGMTQNCTVAFFSQCMSLKKCKLSCKSMGAMQYRWFHEYGCCQCVGSTCGDYGLREPRCLQCPPTSETAEKEMLLDSAKVDSMYSNANRKTPVVKDKVSGDW